MLSTYLQLDDVAVHALTWIWHKV